MSDEWPLPPPFMWACDTCVELLRQLSGAFTHMDADPFYDGAVRLPVTLARHVADAHPGGIPAPHTDGCEQCDLFESRNDGDPGKLWAEHRARGIFLPVDMARLL